MKRSLIAIALAASLPFAATAFGTFLIRQGFKGVPPEIQDATRLDGYGHMAFLWRFAVPLTRPVIASFTVISALGAWNQYLWPQAVIDDSRFETAQIALKSITATEVANANVGVAAALIVALPVVALLVAFQKQIIRGLTAGAVKEFLTTGVTPSIGPLELDLVILRMALGPVALDVSLLSLLGVLLAYLIARSLF